VKAWRDNSGFGRTLLVKQYIGAVQGFSTPEVVTEAQLPLKPLTGIAGLLDAARAQLLRMLGEGGGDPFFAVVARKL
jgi:hypothetical protein